MATLLQDAIAEAKQLREAAMRNAYIQLENSLTPSIKEMLAKKLDEEEEIVNEEDEENLEEAVKTLNAEKEAESSEAEPETAEDPESLDVPEESNIDDQEDENSEEKPEEEHSETVEDEEAIEEPETEEDTEDEQPEEVEAVEKEADDEINLEDMTLADLKAIVSDMVAQLITEPAPDGDLGVDLDAGEVEGMGEEDTPILSNEFEEDEEEIDLSEILRGVDDSKEAASELAEIKEKLTKSNAELAEAKRNLAEVTEMLSEVNLLNRKLKYVTKILGSKQLSESQKANVISSFDRVKTSEEAENIYNALNENLSEKKGNTLLENRCRASRSAGMSTALKTQQQTDESVKRLQRLAGIID